MLNINFILKMTILVLYILVIFILVKVVKDTKALRKKFMKNKIYSNQVRKKNKYNKFFFVCFGVWLALLLSAQFNVVLPFNRNFIITILLTIAELIFQCLYIIFNKKRKINPNMYNLYKDKQKTIYWLFAAWDILFVLIILIFIE